jgi:hypothetical protein
VIRRNQTSDLLLQSHHNMSKRVCKRHIFSAGRKISLIIFVDLEHASQRDDPVAGLRSMGRRLMVKYRLEEMSGHDCLIVNYDRVTPAFLSRCAAAAVFVSGNQTDLSAYHENDLAGLRSIYVEGRWPVLNFCGVFSCWHNRLAVLWAPSARMETGRLNGVTVAFFGLSS